MDTDIVEKNKTILFYNGTAHKGANFTHLNSDEIKTLLGFEYMFSSLSATVESCWRFYDIYLGKDKVKKLAFLKDPEQVLVVHKITDKIGWSLTTSIMLKKDTIILDYLGEQIPYSRDTEPIYSINVGYSKDILKPYIDAMQAAGTSLKQKQLAGSDLDKKYFEGLSLDLNFDRDMVSAAHKGNLARFAMHMPNELPSGLHNIKLANLKVMNFIGDDGQPHAFFITKQDVEPFEELGWDYGPQYKWGDTPPQYLHAVTNDVYEERHSDL